jgi:hypothetical protein
MLTGDYTTLAHVQHARVLRFAPGKFHRGGHEHLSLAFEQVLKTSHDGGIELGKDVIQEQNTGLTQLGFDVSQLGQLEEHGEKSPLTLGAVAP